MADMTNIHKEIIIRSRIFLKGFPPTTSEEELHKLFDKYGCIVETKIIRDHSGHSKGFGFITFDSQQVAQKVISTYACKTIDIDGMEVTVGVAKIRRRPPTKNFNRPYGYMENGKQPPLPPCTVSADGLVSYYQQPPYSVSPDGMFTLQPYMSPDGLVSFPPLFPLQQSVFVGEAPPPSDGETYTDAYHNNPDRGVTSKPRKALVDNPSRCEGSRHEGNELIAKNKMTSPNGNTSECRGPRICDVPHKAMPMGYGAGFPFVNNHFVNVNGSHGNVMEGNWMIPRPCVPLAPVNFDQSVNCSNLKDQPFVWLTTAPGKMNRVVVAKS